MFPPRFLRAKPTNPRLRVPVDLRTSQPPRRSLSPARSSRPAGFAAGSLSGSLAKSAQPMSSSKKSTRGPTRAAAGLRPTRGQLSRAQNEHTGRHSQKAVSCFLFPFFLGSLGWCAGDANTDPCGNRGDSGVRLLYGSQPFVTQGRIPWG